MSSYCVISSCKTDKKKGAAKKSIFRFPLKNEQLLKRWLSNIPMDFSNFSFNNSSTRICEDHFEENFKIRGKGESGKYVRLTPDAVPTIFVNVGSSNEVPKTPKRKPRRLKRKAKKIELKKLPITDLYNTCRFCLQTIGEGRVELDDDLKEQFEMLTLMKVEKNKL